MFKLAPLCLASLLLLLLPACAIQATPAAATADDALAARIDAVFAPHYAATKPGATVIVSKDGKIVLRKAYGLADVAGKVAMRPEMSLRIGSMTKQFTATAILLLAEEGKLSLSDSITRFLPDYPRQGTPITVEHLLTHTSGVVSYTSKPGFRTNAARNISVARMIDSFKGDPLEFAPGTRYAYNNSGYFLLGAIIEKVSGMSYAKFVEQRIFVPLGMTQTAYEGMERSPTMRAAGHRKTTAGFVPSQIMSVSQSYAAGSLVSTVDDLARWDAAVAAGMLLKPASWTQALSPYKLADGKSTAYGYGWHVGKLRGDRAIHHGGGISGFSSYAVRLPEHNVYVVVLTNAEAGMARPTHLGNMAAAIAIGKPFQEYKAVKIDAAALDAFAGTYKVDGEIERTVRRERDHLIMQRSGRAPVVLYAFAPDEFFMKDAITVFKFGRNANGHVVELTLNEDGAETVNPRTPATP